MAPQLAWIGLGNMGRGMCKNLVEKGKLDKPLILYNRTTARAQELADKIGSSTVAQTIPEAVGAADIIFICLGDDKAVNENVDTILQSDVSGKLIVDCSTLHPDSTEALAKRIGEKGAHFVACPVFGAPAMADAGQLVCVVAGPAADVAKVTPYCEGVMGRAQIVFSDEPPRKALLLKLVGNSFVLQMVEALAEGHTVAEVSGLGPENLHKWIEIMFPGPYTAYSNRMLTGDYYARESPLFAVDLGRKDARHVMDLAAKGGARMKAVELVDQHLAKVKEYEGEKGDGAGIYGAVRMEAGLPFENGKKKQ